ncbi:MAG: hypothetical protein JO104_10095 [Candidatus Eremiobacteraeota bacterium]|nr:hypothetical protein [Candidatus Eremiobacteraeota bacterium]
MKLREGAAAYIVELVVIELGNDACPSRCTLRQYLIGTLRHIHIPQAKKVLV